MNTWKTFICMIAFGIVFVTLTGYNEIFILVFAYFMRKQNILETESMILKHNMTVRNTWLPTLIGFVIPVGIIINSKIITCIAAVVWGICCVKYADIINAIENDRMMQETKKGQ